jgi:hypothetical protein
VDVSRCDHPELRGAIIWPPGDWKRSCDEEKVSSIDKDLRILYFKVFVLDITEGDFNHNILTS